MWLTAFAGAMGRQRRRRAHSNAAAIEKAPAMLPVTSALRA
jgi:hypothetical protein